MRLEIKTKERKTMKENRKFKRTGKNTNAINRLGKRMEFYIHISEQESEDGNNGMQGRD